MPRHWFSWIAWVCWLLIVVAAPISGRLVPPQIAVALIATAGFLGFGLAGLSLVFLIFNKSHLRRLPVIRSAVIGLLAGFVMLVLFKFPQAPSPHRFNDVTTEFSNPPEVQVGPNKNAVYPARFSSWQTSGYPELQALTSNNLPIDVYFIALAEAKLMPGWELLSEDPNTFTFQAVSRTPVFRFEDDIVVRVRADGEGTRIDARSKSRFGTGDRGANANRIRDYFEKVKPLL